tara:strand:+ start:474 stop:701 length:228 start_codon:yes stop_codon:yes gene_type:complete
MSNTLSESGILETLKDKVGELEISFSGKVQDILIELVRDEIEELHEIEQQQIYDELYDLSFYIGELIEDQIINYE